MRTWSFFRRLAFAAACASSLRLMAAGQPAAQVNGLEIVGSVAPDSLQVPQVSGPVLWKDPSQPLEVRVRDLLSRMSLAEKATQLRADAEAIPRLGIHAFSYRNEGIHGVAHAGIATVFPQTIGMAATWDTALIKTEADVIATEGRAKFNDYAQSHDGDGILHYCISFYAPNINIVRDPRWGRAQETYGEDPFLTSRMAVAYIGGLQGDDPRYVKAMAGAKHYVVHSGPEPGRLKFNATPPEQDLYDTYLIAFEASVREAHVGSIMGAYSALNGIPDCANPFLLNQILRDTWGFKGFVVSDGGAIQNLYTQHKYVPTAEEAAAIAVKNGCDLYSASVAGKPKDDYLALGRMLKRHLLSEAEIDRAVGRTLAARFRLGVFDPPEMVPWSKLTIADNDTPAHRELALKVAQESIVLLKNDGVLPLDRQTIRHLAVIGPNATAVAMLQANYDGTPSHPVTIMDGIRQAAGPSVEVTYVQGCPLALRNDQANRPTAAMTDEAVTAARAADVVIFVGGTDARLAGERHTVNFQGFHEGDLVQLELPEPQEALLKRLRETGKPVVFVNCSGSATAIPWEAEALSAIVEAWYPGEEGGRAVGDVLFGNVNPAGRLPLTFYRSTSELPSFTDYAMANRTYRYFGGTPLYAFGHGLSYTRFDYSDLKVDSAEVGPDETIALSFRLTNSGKRAGDEVAQVYVKRDRQDPALPRIALCGFSRVSLADGASTLVKIPVPARLFRHWDIAQKRYVVDPGGYELFVGGASDELRLSVPVTVKPQS